MAWYDFICKFRDSNDTAWKDANNCYWRSILRKITRGARRKPKPDITTQAITSSDYGRKPYVGSGDYGDLMSRVTRSSMQQKVTEQFSYRDKPYLEDSYEEMEQFMPTPLDRFDYPFAHPTYRESPPLSDRYPQGRDYRIWSPGGGYQIGGCKLNLVNPLYCDEPVRVSAAMFSGPRENLNFKVFVDGSSYGEDKIEKEEDRKIKHTGIATNVLEIWPPSDGWNPVANEACPSPTEDQNVVEVKMSYEIDGVKYECSDKLRVFCYGECESTACDCETAETFELDDDSTPDTIASGGNIDVYVTGGCAPYTWSVSGTGATWNSSGTSSLESSNLSEQLDLADGTCGDGNDYSPVITVIVTDACETEVSKVLRATGDDDNAPDWVGKESKNAVMDDPCVAETCSMNSYDLIEGEHKWTLNVTPVLGNKQWCERGTVNWDASGLNPPSCGSPTECMAATAICWADGGNPCDCMYTDYDYYHWECA